MRGEHITFVGATNGADVAGTIDLRADVVYGTASAIRIPRGLALKIWSKHINGADVTVTTEFTTDVGVDTPDWVAFSTDVFVADVEGDRNIEKRRPILFRGLSGKEAVRFTYDQSNAGVSGIEVNAEFCEIQ